MINALNVDFSGYRRAGETIAQGRSGIFWSSKVSSRGVAERMSVDSTEVGPRDNYYMHIGFTVRYISIIYFQNSHSRYRMEEWPGAILVIMMLGENTRYTGLTIVIHLDKVCFSVSLALLFILKVVPIRHSAFSFVADGKTKCSTAARFSMHACSIEGQSVSAVASYFLTSPI